MEDTFCICEEGSGSLELICIASSWIEGWGCRQDCVHREPGRAFSFAFGVNVLNIQSCIAVPFYPTKALESYIHNLKCIENTIH